MSALTDALAWAVIAAFLLAAVSSTQNERVERYTTTGAWVVFAAFWGVLAPHFAFTQRSIIEGALSTYAFLPWSDAVVCGCPYKQTNNWAVMCKHELAAASCLANAHEEGLDAKYVLPIAVGVVVPQRARRFVSPTVVATHTPRRSR